MTSDAPVAPETAAPAPPRARRGAWRAATTGWPAVLAGVTVLAALARALRHLRLYAVSDDAVTYAAQARVLAEDGLAAACDRFAFPPLDALAAAALAVPLGSPLAALQALGLIAGIVAAPLAAVWVAGLAGRRVGAAAGLLVALHPLHARMSADANADALYSLFVIAALWALGPGSGRRGDACVAPTYPPPPPSPPRGEGDHEHGTPGATAGLPGSAGNPLVASYQWHPEGRGVRAPTRSPAPTAPPPRRRAAAAGLLLGLAFLTMPDALALLAGALLWGAAMRWRRREARRAWAGWLLALAAGWAAVAAPYIVFIARDGHVLTKKVDLLQPLLGGRLPGAPRFLPSNSAAPLDDSRVLDPWPVAEGGTPHRRAGELAGDFTRDLAGRAAGYLGVPLLLACWALGRGRRGGAARIAPGAGGPAAVMAAFAAAAVLLSAAVKGDLSSRHLFVFFLLALPWLALGTERLRGWGAGRSAGGGALAAGLCWGVIGALWGAMLARAERFDKRGLAEAGRAVREAVRADPDGGPAQARPAVHPRLMLDPGLERAAVYAGAAGPLLVLPRDEYWTDERLAANARRHEVAFLLRRYRPGEYELGLAPREAAGGVLELLGAFPARATANDLRLLVYRVRP